MTYKEVLTESFTQKFMEDKITVDQYTSLIENIDIIVEGGKTSILKQAGAYVKTNAAKLNVFKSWIAKVDAKIAEVGKAGIGKGEGQFTSARAKANTLKALQAKKDRLMLAAKHAPTAAAGAAGVAVGAGAMKYSQER